MVDGWVRSEALERYAKARSIEHLCVSDLVSVVLMDMRIMADSMDLNDAALFAGGIVEVSEKYIGERWYQED